MSAKLFIVVVLIALVCGTFGEEDDPPPAKILLTNPKNSSERTELIDDFSGVDVGKDTIVLIHGWRQDGTIFFYYDIPKEYHIKGNYNVILVDWGVIANNLYFLKSSPRTLLVGNYLGDFLLKLSKATGLDFNRVHLIGHSLGAHVAGCAAKKIKDDGKLVSRITALDAANPNFSTYQTHEREYRLTESDAAAVIVVHTDGGGYGLRVPIGTCDFYANGGVAPQRPCYMVQSLWEVFKSSSYFCSHRMSILYFTESINSKVGFIGRNCTGIDPWSSCDESETATFGPDTPADTRGLYYFKTHYKSPYARGSAGI